MNICLWTAIKCFEWTLAYLAFHEGSAGATSLLKFTIWVVAIIAVFAVNDDIIKKFAKKPANARQLLSLASEAAMTGVLVWNQHIATGVASAFSVMTMLVVLDLVAKQRLANSNPG